MKTLTPKMMACLNTIQTATVVTWESLLACSHAWELRCNKPTGNTLNALIKRKLVVQYRIKDSNAFVFRITELGRAALKVET